MLHTLSMSRSPITSMQFSAQGDWLALGSAAMGQLLVWDWRAETYVLRQQGHHHEAAALAFSPDGGMLASGADDAKVALLMHSVSQETKGCSKCKMVWDWRAETYVLRQQGHHHEAAALAFSPNGGMLASGADDAKVALLMLSGSQETLNTKDGAQNVVWDWTAETYVLRQQGHHHEAAALAFSPDGGMLASGADDAKVGLSLLCDLTLGDPLYQSSRHCKWCGTGGLRPVCCGSRGTITKLQPWLSPDGGMLASGADDAKMGLLKGCVIQETLKNFKLPGFQVLWDWRAETYVLPQGQQWHHHETAALASFPAGGMLASAAEDVKARLGLLFHPRAPRCQAVGLPDGVGLDSRGLCAAAAWLSS